MANFFNKIKIKSLDECWEWEASSRGNGYGAYKYQHKTTDAHRVMWILHNGEIPERLFVCHTCDNPKCVNPFHLFLGTHSDNMKDAYNKGRLSIPKGKRFQDGHVGYGRSLSSEEASELKEKIANRKSSLKELAKELNISYQLIRDINCGRIYKE